MTWSWPMFGEFIVYWFAWKVSRMLIIAFLRVLAHVAEHPK